MAVYYIYFLTTCHFFYRKTKSLVSHQFAASNRKQPLQRSQDQLSNEPEYEIFGNVPRYLPSQTSASWKIAR